MRQELIDYIGDQNLGSFILSQELPYDSSGTALYVKNPKRIYVDRTQYTTEPIILTLDGVNISNEIASVRVYFASDAKQLPPSYDDALTSLRAGKDAVNIVGYQRRECLVSSRFQEDLMITELEYRFTKIT
jgi:hypothetical protein